MTTTSQQLPAVAAEDRMWQNPPQEYAAHKTTSAILTVDREGLITETNALARRLLGCSHEAIGQHYGRYLQFCHLSDESAHRSFDRDPVELCLSTAQPFYVFGLLRGIGAGPLQAVEACLTPLYADLVVTGAIVTIEDLDAQNDIAH